MPPDTSAQNVKSNTIGKIHDLSWNVTYKNANIIYFLQCNHCDMENIGESAQPYESQHNRMNDYQTFLFVVT